MTVSQEFAGQVVLVTGGARGVGRTVARRFAERGAHVIINWFHAKDDAAAVLAEFERDGLSAELRRASVARERSVVEMFRSIGERHGRLDVLVNNAAHGTFLPVHDLTEKDWARSIDTGFHGVRWCCREAAPLMRERGGAIVNLSSTGAQLVVDNYASVGSVKAAVEAYTRYLAYELAPHRIRVNVASGGFVEGPVIDLFPRSSELREVVTSATPLGSLVCDDDLASAVLFLASNGARGITGQVLTVDGGLNTGAALLSPRRGEPSDADPLTPDRGRGTGDRRPPDTSAATSTDGCPDGAVPAEDEHLVAVVGVGVAVPGASTPDEFWTLLRKGRSAFSEPGDRFDLSAFWSPDPAAEDRSYSRVAGYLHDFAPHPRLAAELANGDPIATEAATARWLRHCLAQALDDVSVRPDDRHACYVGQWVDGSHDLEESLVAADVRAWVRDERRHREPASSDEPALDAVLARHLPRAQADPDRFLPERIIAAAARGLLPPDSELLAVDAACASSLYAIDLGVRRLLDGSCDVAVCGGVYENTPRHQVLFAKLRGLSRTGRVRSLDAGADGTLFSDGAAVVALKRLDRARADGDDVLAVITGFGSSSDGRGKAIQAPNGAGQRLALERADAASGVRTRQLDWIIAHATGTPSGDATEAASIQAALAGRPLPVTADKSVVGHTGWAAGAVSVVHAVLALRHGLIPAHRHFTAPPAGTAEHTPDVRVPTVDIEWPRVETQPRRIGVSAFGFGGINGHLRLQDVAPPTTARRDVDDDPVVVVGWHADLPGEPGEAEIRRWLTEGFPDTAATYGDDHPIPPPAITGLAPGIAVHTDRTQLLALRAAARLLSRLDGLTELAPRAGVLVGVWEPPRRSTEFTLRTYASILERIAEDLAGQGDAPASRAVSAALRRTRGRVPASGPNSTAGVMPNVTAARVANRWNLHGLTMAVSGAQDAVLNAVDLAERYLASGELDLALVLGVNGSATRSAATLTGVGVDRIAEGAFVFALTRTSLARKLRLPVMARIDTAPGRQSVPRAPVDDSRPSFLSADGAVPLLRALLGDANDVCLPRSSPGARRLRVTAVGGSGGRPDPDAVSRHALVHVEEPGDGTNAAVTAVPDGSLVLTNSPVVAARLAKLSAPARVICTDTRCQDEGVVVMSDVDDDTLRRAGVVADELGHVRVVADLDTDEGAADTALRRLHECAFLAARMLWTGDRVAARGVSTFCSLLLAPRAVAAPPAAAGLFSGLVGSLAFDLPGTRFVTVVADTHDVDAGLARLVEESTNRQTLRGAWYRGGSRYVTRILAVGTDTGREPAYPEPPVIVAAGGGRGITSSCLLALAATTPATLWLLGRTPLDGIAPELLAMGEAEFAARRRDLVRAHLDDSPGATVADARRAVDRIRSARLTHQSITRLREVLGADNVHHLVCDVRDPAATARAAARVLSAHPRVDLFVNAAGIRQGASPGRKRLADFRAVVSTKVDGYRNLKAAFGPNVARWCNFGSLAGSLGLPGEADYCSANGFLDAAALHASATSRTDEFTIGWTMWHEVGMGDDAHVPTSAVRHGLMSTLPVQRGQSLFLAALACPDADPVTLTLGPVELRALGDRIGHAAPVAPTSGYLGRRVAPGTWQRTFDLGGDPYLDQHRVDGRPTLPGTCVLELAAEAATATVPGTRVQRFEKVRFHAFVRPHPVLGQVSCGIESTVVANSGGGDARVRVRLTDGHEERLVRRPRLCASVEVVLVAADRPHCRTEVTGWAVEPGRAVVEPYQVEGSPLTLGGVFLSTGDWRVGERCGSAALRLADLSGTVFTGLTLPVLTLDALLRCGALDAQDRRGLPVAVPTGCDLIEVNTTLNDVGIRQRYRDRVLLRADHDASGAVTCTAVAPDGSVLARVSGLDRTVIGWAREDAGGWHVEAAGPSGDAVELGRSA